MNDDLYARAGRVMFVLVWIIVFIGFYVFFNTTESLNGKEIRANQSEYVVSADADGSYVIKGSLNQYPVEFLVDTGASLVAIPQQIADKLQLKGRYPITLTTANGETTGSLTRVEELSFGAFTLHDVKAVIITNSDDTVLLGMSVLEHFNISQDKKQLILKRL